MVTDDEAAAAWAVSRTDEEKAAAWSGAVQANDRVLAAWAKTPQGPAVRRMVVVDLADGSLVAESETGVLLCGAVRADIGPTEAWIAFLAVGGRRGNVRLVASGPQRVPSRARAFNRALAELEWSGVERSVPPSPIVAARAHEV